MEEFKNLLHALLFLDIDMFGIHVKPIYLIVISILGAIFKIVFGGRSSN